MLWVTLAAFVLSVLALALSVWSLLFARFVEEQLVEMEKLLEQFEQQIRRPK